MHFVLSLQPDEMYCIWYRKQPSKKFPEMNDYNIASIGHGASIRCTIHGRPPTPRLWQSISIGRHDYAGSHGLAALWVS